MLFYMVDLKPSSEAILRMIETTEGSELSIREIKERHNLGDTTIRMYLKRLEALGFIQRQRTRTNQPYTFFLTGEGKALLSRSNE